MELPKNASRKARLGLQLGRSRFLAPKQCAPNHDRPLQSFGNRKCGSLDIHHSWHATHCTCFATNVKSGPHGKGCGLTPLLACIQCVLKHINYGRYRRAWPFDGTAPDPSGRIRARPAGSLRPPFRIAQRRKTRTSRCRGQRVALRCGLSGGQRLAVRPRT